ncbi:MAG: ribosome maturation factor RimM [Blastocatellia bacterium]|nr:ribosome maturation factor RimM [Blastocatellia bacterium]
MIDARDKPSEDVVIARIVKARGIRGEVACEMETAFPERFLSLERVIVKMPDGGRERLVIEDSWFHKGRVVLKFEGCDTRTEAERLAGGLLVIAESDALPLEEGEFYEYQIIGSEVFVRGGASLGRVARLMRTGASDLLVIEGRDGREYLVPFVDDICPEVDVSAKRIIVDPPDGLLEL